ncbi:Protein translocase subunit SecA [Candidatus Nanosyncoccus alces]|uniref:Protein translocase subunit SecA n=2 Tax=Candidatus Nanosyncoccus alces TaxID=2171997 RepID=A0ABY0FP76_9BACT|nr:Protein translocase subunit SecA [Candidatus Nanosyncoccus alces]
MGEDWSYMAKKEKKPTDKLADKTALTKFLQGIFGDAQKKTLRRMWKKAQEVNKLESKYEKMDDEELAEQTEIFKKKIDKALKVARAEQGINRSGKKRPPVDDTKILNELLPDVFAVAREVSKRVLGLRPYDVQLIGGIALHEGNVAEMKTGEGKTLVAMLPAYLNGLTGRGVHVVTVNDYLAQRDAGWNGPIYDFLGMSVGVIINNASFVYDSEYENEDHEDERFRHLKPATRKEAYAADITYGTNNEFGFDYLRDNMTSEVQYLRQRGLNFAIVDEVDSILIDEARTPLIISAPAGDNPDSYYQFAKVAARLTPEDYILDEKRRSVTLTDKGIEKVQEILGVDNLYSTKNTRLVYHLEQAIRAEIIFKRDKDYVVTNSGEVIIVDEHTGRLMQGRRYNEGLHQAIEAKEGVVVKQESMTLATISFQNFFRLYTKLSGMTGTAFTEAEEFQQIYALDVIQIPPNKPIARVDKDDLIYKTKVAKLKAIAEEIKKYHEKGQPVLVGSGSIANNEEIARYLDAQGIHYEILNAKNNEREAAIIAKAGEKGAITLATNMAGRGTDIKLGDGVKELGGLVVIGSERHDSRRVDNQLRGRGGRQGDPGTTQFFVSCEDDLMRIFQGDRVKMLMTRLGVDDDMPIQTKAISKTLEAAQKRIEGFNFDSRKNVVQYDNVINRHRKVVYMMRRKILEGDDIFPEIKRLMRDEVKMLTEFSSRVNKKFDEEFKAVFDFDDDLIHEIGLMRKEKDRDKLALEAVEEAYHKKELEFGAETMRKVEREVYLKVLDTLWMQHLENMQHLREGIHWRSVGQRDPLVEYRSESQKLFDGLQRNLREEVLKILLSITPAEAAADNVTDGEEYESELTKMAEGQTERGVNEISAGDKNMDDEFKKGAKKTAPKRAVVRKGSSKKKSAKKKKSKAKRK